MGNNRLVAQMFRSTTGPEGSELPVACLDTRQPQWNEMSAAADLMGRLRSALRSDHLLMLGLAGKYDFDKQLMLVINESEGRCRSGSLAHMQIARSLLDLT